MFAGALEGVFSSFAGDFNADSHNLYQNHRSKPRIRRVHNAMVRVMDPPAAVEDIELAGNDGDVKLHGFATDDDEAAALAAMIEVQIDGGTRPSDIAILISKQPDLYMRKLFNTLDQRGIPYRNEQTEQDLVTEPLFRLVNDYLLVTIGKRQADAYFRFMGGLIEGDLDDEDEHRARHDWEERLSADRRSLAHDYSTAAIKAAVEALVDDLGDDFIRSLSFDYEQGTYVDDVFTRVLDLVHETFKGIEPPDIEVQNLGNPSAVRILTVHKSKGLEFDTVYFVAIENETFWGKPVDERCAFFVGVSRAKSRLVLTTSGFRERPANAYRWDANRTPHEEFLGYARPEVN